jgi:hypothetical protein
MASSRASIPGTAAPRTRSIFGNLKGVGRVYQQTFIDTYTKVAFAKLYDRKTPITAADLLNDRVLPFFDEHDVKLLRVLTDRGSEFCGNPERHEYELYLAVEDITHAPRLRARKPMVSLNASTRPRSTNFTASPSAKRCTVQSTNCRPTWTCGSEDTMNKGRIRDAGASANRRCRHSLMRCR